jgi:hypothetical protein
MTDEEKAKLEQIYSERLRNVRRYHSAPLIERIRNAFAGISYPGDENLIGSPEHRAECEECEGIYNFFVGKTWEEALEKDADGWLDYGQSFFKPLAWQYYLPAFLIQGINEESFSSFYFAPNDDPSLVDFEENRVELLSAGQCSVIVEFLQISGDLSKGIHDWIEEDNLEALNYWKKNYQKALSKEQNLEK